MAKCAKCDEEARGRSVLCRNCKRIALTGDGTLSPREQRIVAANVRRANALDKTRAGTPSATTLAKRAKRSKSAPPSFTDSTAANA